MSQGIVEFELLAGFRPGAEEPKDARLSVARLAAGETLALDADPKRHYWLQVVKGRLTADDVPLKDGDGLAMVEQRTLQLAASEASEVLVFDMG